MTAPVKPAATQVAAAKARIENLTAAQVAQEVKRTDVVLLDVREPEERAREGVIEGAVPVPRGMLEFAADPTSPYHNPRLVPERRVVVYCASGGRSALAAATLRDMGYPSVANLDGGFKGWKDQGWPVVRTE